MNIPRKRIILFYNKSEAVSVKKLINNNDKPRWMYIGRDYNDMLSWRDRLSDMADQIETGKKLQQKAMQSRRQFMDFIAETGRVNNDFVRLSSNVFEKNTVISPLYLYVCYLEILREHLSRNHDAETIIVVCESPALISAIKDNFSGDNYEIVIVRNLHSAVVCLRNYLNVLLMPLVFIFFCLFHFALAKVSRNKYPVDKGGGQGKKILIRTWVSDKFFSSDGAFKDSYFNGLTGWLTAKGYDVRLLPILVNTRVPVWKFISYLRKPENRFLLPWDYLEITDIFKTIGRGLGQVMLRFDKTSFRGFDISRLLLNEKLIFALSNRSLNCILQYYLFKRLKEAAVKIDRVLYTFENMLPEKLFVYSLRKFYPGTPVIGFQHSVLYPLLLTLYISNKETGSAPLPDKIVCSGDFFKMIFSKEGYPENILLSGPALRFGYLFSHNSNNVSFGNSVVMILPGYKNDALYLLMKTLSALKNTDIKVHIKPHPLTDLKDIEQVMERVNFPADRIVIDKQSMQEVLQKAGLVISISSSVIFDAIAFGVPVLRVKKEVDLDLDPADWLDVDSKRDFVAFTAEDIETEVKRALSLTEKDREAIKDFGRQFVEETFNQITEDTLSVFLR